MVAGEVLFRAKDVSLRLGGNLILEKLGFMRLGRVRLLRGELATGPGLSGRDRQVLELIGDGLTDRQIAQRLNEPVEEAKGEVLSLLGKLGLRGGPGTGASEGLAAKGV